MLTVALPVDGRRSICVAGEWQAEEEEGFEGFEGLEGLDSFAGQFRTTRKKGFGAPEPRAHSLRNSAHNLAQPPLVALSVPNAPSESLGKKILSFLAQILAPNT